MLELLLVAVGGGIGAITRYLTSLWAAERFGSAFPYGTFIANVVGCFIIGLFMTIFTAKAMNPQWRLFVSVGFLGGLTTFSSFSYESLQLLYAGNFTGALTNLAGNLVVGFLATWMGILVARMI